MRVNTDNIAPDEKHNFEIRSSYASSNIPYDFESIMHYSAYAFSRCTDETDNYESGCPNSEKVGPTIEVQPPYQEWQNIIGQRSEMSRTDELMLSFVYPNPNYRFFNIEHVGRFSGGQLLLTAQ